MAPVALPFLRMRSCTFPRATGMIEAECVVGLPSVAFVLSNREC